MELSREARLIAAEVGAIVLIALVVVAAAAIASSWGKSAALKPTVTVATLRGAAVAGVIGRGTINGKGWQVQLMPGKTWRGVSQCGPADHLAVDCQLGYTYLWGRFPDKAEPAFLNGWLGTLFGQVRRNVSSVEVRLSNGIVVRLRPVEAYGRRWIGLAFPDGLSVAMVTVYGDGSAHGAELAHAVPWRGEFYTWLPPGDPGPRAVTKAINRAVVPWATLQVGPWGNCVAIGSSDSSCFPLGDRDYATWFWHSGDAPYTPRELIVAVRPDVVSVLVTLLDGRTVRMPVVRGAGIGLFAVKVLAHPGIMLWGAYDAAGHRVSGGIGAPDTAPGV